jgi:hypothetical protein
MLAGFRPSPEVNPDPVLTKLPHVMRAGVRPADAQGIDQGLVALPSRKQGKVRMTLASEQPLSQL